MINNVVNSWWLIKISLCFLVGISNFYFFTKARKKCQAGFFYSDVPALMWLGIFVWGDALILAPFWSFSAILFIFLPEIVILRYVLLFFILRSLFEVIYWLNHQSVKDSYQPPFFRRVAWIGPNEAAILYQVMNTCQLVVLISFFIWTFRW